MADPTPALTDVEGLLVGHVTDREAATGCTVVLGPPEGMAAGVAVRGRATGTREFDALSPRHLVPGIHAILLTGGSAFGLGAADGVMRWLAERGRGFDVGVGVVPIVPAAVVFDLALLGRSDRWPGPAEGYRACEAAGGTVEEGSVGVGTGATVGKVTGPAGAMKSGVGSWAEQRDGVVVGALAVVNAYGDVRDGEGQILAGARRGGEFVDARRYLAEGGAPGGSFARAGANTTLVVVGTNARLSRGELAETAAMSVDAMAQRITPLGTQFDGDIVFAVSTEKRTGVSPIAVEMLAQEAVAMAIERAVRTAVGTDAVPGLAG
ncbi:MAG: P1 family peptidase [Gemmatimonadota bacterium]|nr:MAG: P1 family peptidase [Gemmatimonadota bacterium]